MNKPTIISAVLTTVAALARIISFACGALAVGPR